jgi:hypothetical protein
MLVMVIWIVLFAGNGVYLTILQQRYLRIYRAHHQSGATSLEPAGARRLRDVVPDAFHQSFRALRAYSDSTVQGELASLRRRLLWSYAVALVLFVLFLPASMLLR